MNDVLKRLQNFTAQSDLAVAISVLLIICIMLIPIPPVVLDLFFSMTISSSVIILLICIYVKRPLEFSTFPSVLLVTTLFRISLNIASTRNILIHGPSDGTAAAGKIIESFGEFVVQGNYAVGLIMFIILVVFNFMVITKGAGRVAEVAARFTLDAMPGKQMAIDADLNAGLINDVEAKKRRQEIAVEADFYGSMDGASKFVRGDAIAGLIVTGINIVGGIFIGVVQNNLQFMEAVQTFTLLTVGDGLVAQVPALIISTAAGIIATRNTSEASLGNQIGEEIRIHPKAIIMGASALFIMPILGMPIIPFWSVGACLLLVAYKFDLLNVEKEKEKEKGKVEEKKATSETLENLLSLDLIELEVGYGLVNLVDSSQNGDLLERITHIRKQMAIDWGVIIPSVKIRDNLELKPAGYVIKIKGVPIAKGDLMTDHYLAMDPGTVLEKIDGVDTKEPVFGLPAVWISESQKDEAQYNGYTVVDLSTVIATHLTEILKNNLHELLGRQELNKLLEHFKQDYPKIVSDLIPDILSTGIVLKVLQNLLRENVSIRDLRTILESLAEHGVYSKDSEALTEWSRKSLCRTITQAIKNEQGEVPVVTLDKNIEDVIYKSLVKTDSGTFISLPNATTQTLIANINEKIEDHSATGEKAVLMCSPQIRPQVKNLIEKFMPSLIVISHNELSPEINIKSIGTVRL